VGGVFLSQWKDLRGKYQWKIMMMADPRLRSVERTRRLVVRVGLEVLL